MSNQVGEKLIGLNHGDVPTIITADALYRGEVININRQMCNLTAGFMEDGYIGIELKAEEKIIKQHNLPSRYLFVSATEDVPQSWSNPTVSTYKPATGEIIETLGTVTEIKLDSD